MNIIQEIKKAIWAKYQTSTLWTVQHIPMHLDKFTPQSKVYPVIGVFHVSSNLTMAMPSTIQPAGFNYSDGRWQMSIWGNDRQHAELETIADELEDLYHRSSLTTGNGVSHIATISYNNNTTFWDEKQKIWGIHLQFRILAGK